ncbi:phage integrase SAM-like domain-containing protein [Prevotella nigrescens]|uniref:phage integrase SAM-like domain-containing protein n=1 Tax=Prevotella nigrescens TaxID=28133 RepID=UPI0028D3AA05|nr:phage integrase SAM-like domain-containing protein [Prevotella nigrescens]
MEQATTAKVEPINTKAKPNKTLSKQSSVPTLVAFTLSISNGVSHSTVENYRTAMRSFVRFNGGNDIQLSTISETKMRQYERWLHLRGISPKPRRVTFVHCVLFTTRLWQDAE